DHGVSVRTASAHARAVKLVIAAGPWASTFIPQLNVHRKPVFWFHCGPEFSVGRGAGTFFFETPAGQFYGFPSLDGQTFKVAEHTGGQPVSDPAAVDRSLHAADLESVRQFLRSHVPAAQLELVRHSVCLYTLTPDHHFLIDHHPSSDRIIVAAGFSGHGFKFAPVIGQALADLALHGQTNLPIDFLGWNRAAMM
ncbi:MAG: FAD-dependent oxidoreductase, partial [Planctomycetaceae bacterium]